MSYSVELFRLFVGHFCDNGSRTHYKGCQCLLTDGAFASDIHGVTRATEWDLVIPVNWFPNVARANWAHWSTKKAKKDDNDVIYSVK